jgi:DNA-binding CsgD family transcriptional regulator
VEEAMSKSIDEDTLDAAVKPRTILFTSDGPVTVVNADFDGDGKLDLVVLDASRHRMRLWRGNGLGGFRSRDNVTGQRSRLQQSPERLTARETEVASLLASGYTDREIATMLGIGCRTAETHASNVRAKLGLRSRRALLHDSICG